MWASHRQRRRREDVHLKKWSSVGTGVRRFYWEANVLLRFCPPCEAIRINQVLIGTWTDTVSLGPMWEFHLIITAFFSPHTFNNKHNMRDNGQTARYWSKPYEWKIHSIAWSHNHELNINCNYLQPRAKTESVVGSWCYFFFISWQNTTVLVQRHHFFDEAYVSVMSQRAGVLFFRLVTTAAGASTTFTKTPWSEASALAGGCKQSGKYIAFNQGGFFFVCFPEGWSNGILEWKVWLRSTTEGWDTHKSLKLKNVAELCWDAELV